ncbi:MAG TPA: LegC family aminotransferase [bacterium]|nr:LegC family aminotransferase [bacterium]
MIALHEPQFNGNEWKYIKDCLDSGWVSSVGKYVDLFEEKLSEYTGAKYVVACCNGTTALHTALLLAGVKEDDEVIVPSLSFIATANVILYCNAVPIFIDCETKHFNIDVEKLDLFLKNNCYFDGEKTINLDTGKIVRAILPVHILGYPTDIIKICDIAKQYKIKVIEDAAESIGTFLNNKHLGTFGDIGCLSFNGNKIITTGGGGAILTNDLEIANLAKYLTQQAKEPHPFEYIHNEIGYNYRLTNLQAALGVAQLEQLENFIEKKIEIEKRYLEFLDFTNKNIYFPKLENDVRWNRWIFSVLLKDIKTIEKRNNIIKKFLDEKIGVRPFWRPIHLQEKFRKFYADDLANTENIYLTGLHLPASVSLQKEDIKKICDILNHTPSHQIVC